MVAHPHRALFVLIVVVGCHGAPRPATPGLITGTVIENGSPATNAVVQLVNARLSATTDEKGSFALGPLASATYAISVTSGADDSAAYLAGIRLNTSVGDDVGTIALESTGGLTGHVRLSGTPVPLAALALVGSDGSRIAGTPVVVSDSSGTYTMTGAPAGQFEVKALFESGSQTVSALSQSVSVIGGRQLSVDLDLSPPQPASAGAVSGMAVYVDGLSQIGFFLSRAGSKDISPPLSGPQFSVSSVAPGLYALGVAADGLAPVAVAEVFVDGDVDVGTVVFSAAYAGGVAVCPSTTPPPCTVGQPGCDPDNVDLAPSVVEVNAACLCYPGEFLAADGSCVNECASPTVACDVNATCLGGTGTNYCTCNSGYVGDGTSCETILPEINELNVTPQAIGLAPGGIITASFQANEYIAPNNVSVTIGNGTSSWPFTCTEMGTQPWIYVCMYSMTGTEISPGTEGQQTVTATISDTRGNSNTATGFVYFDFELPQVTSLSIAYAQGATSASPGSSVTVALTCSEPLASGAPPTVSVGLPSGAMPMAIEPATLTNTTASFTGTIPAGTAPGQYPMTVVLTDFAGNVNTVQPSDGTIDVN